MQNELPGCFVQFYATAAYPCSYLPGRQARSQVAISADPIDPALYSQLVKQGFRRSGSFVYRPHCDHCRACTPTRIPVSRFVPSRSQKRAWKKHAALVASACPLRFDEEHYALYLRYQARRHQGCGMDHDNPENYSQFLLESTVDSRLVVFRENGVLRMVSLIDGLSDGLSSVYTFFDPDLAGSSLGTWNILWQIMECHRQGLPYLYLGYFIAECPKMAYKTRFRPFEYLVGTQWQEGPSPFASLSPHAFRP